MKKTYSKPDIIFEDFSLSTNIAAGCEEKPFGNTNDCGVKWSQGVFIFSGSINGCNTHVIEGDGEYNSLCYHNPENNYNVFNS